MFEERNFAWTFQRGMILICRQNKQCQQRRWCIAIVPVCTVLVQHTRNYQHPMTFECTSISIQMNQSCTCAHKLRFEVRAK